MNSLAELLKEKRGKPLFMAHMIAGYPSGSESDEIAKALAEGGADIIELQIPFSDPMADGPSIAVACEEALAKGASVKSSLELLKKISKFPGRAGGKPVAVMSYVNPVFRFGFLDFAKTIKASGASALIVPDCPFDSPEGKELLAACKEAHIFLIPVVSPGVPAERLAEIAKDSSGFVYCTTRQGITGAKGSFAEDLYAFVKQLKGIFNLPIAVGFGVQTHADVQQLAAEADIVIAGSVFVNLIKEKGAKAASAVEEKTRELLQ